MGDVKAEAAEYGEKMRVLVGQFVGTADRLAMAFLAGAAWQRETDAALIDCCPGCDETICEYRDMAAKIREQTFDDTNRNISPADVTDGSKP